MFNKYFTSRKWYYVLGTTYLVLRIIILLKIYFILKRD